MWQRVHAGTAKRIILDDGTPVLAVLKAGAEHMQAVFFSDASDLNRIEFESEKLGTLPDLIDVLHPADIIEICCRMDEEAKARR